MLLERAFLRIGSAESDEQFETLIEKLLGPIIFKVPSPHETVRKKVCSQNYIYSVCIILSMD